MVRLRRILCPVDFSVPSRAALEHAVDLAVRLHGELTLLHVYQVPGYTFPEGVVVAGPEAFREMNEQVLHSLDEWRQEAERLGAREVAVQTRIGGTSSEIVKAAAEGAFDLIVMGTHGHTGLKHALLGSVAERVVRTAPCPVLTTRPAAEPPDAAGPAAP